MSNDLAKIRRENLKALVEAHGGQSHVSEMVGKAPAYLSQLITGHRNLGEKVGREIEKCLGLTPGWLDIVHSERDMDVQFPMDLWENLDPFGRTLIHSILEMHAHNPDKLNEDERSLLKSYRKSSVKGKEVILAVAMAQRGQKK